MTDDFDQLIDLSDLGPEERSRLHRVHELLVAAGPPAELPASLAGPPGKLGRRGEKGGTVIAFPTRRRAAAALLIAATVSAACFGGGYVIANQTHKSAAIDTTRVVSLSGEQNSFASLRVGYADQSGNWPVQLTVTGLKPLTAKGAHYILSVFHDGKPAVFCGMFKVGAHGTTTVTFSVPYRVTSSTRWGVTEMAPGVQFPGHVVMTTS